LRWSSGPLTPIGADLHSLLEGTLPLLLILQATSPLVAAWFPTNNHWRPADQSLLFSKMMTPLFRPFSQYDGPYPFQWHLPSYRPTLSVTFSSVQDLFIRFALTIPAAAPLLLTRLVVHLPEFIQNVDQIGDHHGTRQPCPNRFHRRAEEGVEHQREYGSEYRYVAQVFQHVIIICPAKISIPGENQTPRGKE